MVSTPINIPAIVMCYKRLDELQLVVDSLINAGASKIYFHLHPTIPESEITDQIKAYIDSLIIDKELLYSEEPLGCRKSFFTSLKFIAEKENKFLFIEDDIVLNEDIKDLKDNLDSLDGILKFGPKSEVQGVFWGWALDKKSALKILETDLFELSYNETKELWENEIHYKGTMELLRRKKVFAWDDEVGMIIKHCNIPVKTMESIVENIGNVSTREGDIPDGNPQGDSYVIYENGILIN